MWLPRGVGKIGPAECRMIPPLTSLPAEMLLATLHPRRMSLTGWLFGSAMAYNSFATYQWKQQHRIEFGSTISRPQSS